MKQVKFLFIGFYFFFAINILCESACTFACDDGILTTYSVPDDCKHVSCELTHNDQHDYVKDDLSDTVAKKFFKDSESYLAHLEYDLSRIDSFHLSQSIQIITQFSESFYLRSCKKYIVFNRITVYQS